jgi:hypothetical protein
MPGGIDPDQGFWLWFSLVISPPALSNPQEWDVQESSLWPKRIGFDSSHHWSMLYAPNSEDEILWQS